MNASLLGLPITVCCSLEQTISDVKNALDAKESLFVSFINPHSYWIAKKYPAYSKDLDRLDRIYCDGSGIVLAAKSLGFEVERLSCDNTSLAGPLFDLCAIEGWSIFLIGGAEGVAKNAGAIILEQFPAVRIAGYSSGYFEEPSERVEAIRNSLARVVLCGMGAPNQERFLIELKESGWTGLAITCGGFLDQLLVRFHYYPPWINQLNIRFLYRLYREPMRLWRRYIVEYRVFFTLWANEWLRRRNSSDCDRPA